MLTVLLMRQVRYHIHCSSLHPKCIVGRDGTCHLFVFITSVIPIHNVSYIIDEIIDIIELQIKTQLMVTYFKQKYIYVFDFYLAFTL